MTALATEVRALLRDFCASGWSELYVRSGGWELFFGRGRTSPMLAAAPSVAAAIEASPAETVHAVHLGLFAPVASEGAAVRAGDLVATLGVLDRLTEMRSSRAGRVRFAHPAGLVEFGDPCFEIA